MLSPSIVINNFKGHDYSNKFDNYRVFLKTLATNQLLVENRTTIFDTVIFNSSLNYKEEQDHRKNTVSQCH